MVGAGHHMSCTKGRQHRKAENLWTLQETLRLDAANLKVPLDIVKNRHSHLLIQSLLILYPSAIILKPLTWQQNMQLVI